MQLGNPRPRTLPRLASLALTASAALLAGPAFAQGELLQSLPEQSRIVGGEAVKHCAWPAAGMVVLLDPNAPEGKNTRLCTASLVHPELVITAAHCFDNGQKPVGVAFTESYKMLFDDKDKKLMRDVERCVQHPKWVNDKTTQGQNLDFAYCKLKTAVTDVPIVPPLMGCEVDTLKAGTPITLVGYGQQSGAQGSAPGDKFEVETTFNGYSTGGEALVGSQGKGACYGDSGGPAYVNLKDKFGKDAGWRVFGVTSSGPKGCPGPANYGMIHKFIEFVEEDSKIEITPCFDAKGKWDPKDSCKGAPLDPRDSKGNWLEQSCEHGPVGGWIKTCGKPAGGDEEEESASGGEDEGDSGSSTGSGDDTEDPKDKDKSKDKTPEDPKDSKDEDSNDEDEDGKKKDEEEDEEKDPSEQAPKDSKDASANDKPKPSPSKGGCSLGDPQDQPWWALALLLLPTLRRRKDRAA